MQQGGDPVVVVVDLFFEGDEFFGVELVGDHRAAHGVLPESLDVEPVRLGPGEAVDDGHLLGDGAHLLHAHADQGFFQRQLLLALVGGKGRRIDHLHDLEHDGRVGGEDLLQVGHGGLGVFYQPHQAQHDRRQGGQGGDVLQAGLQPFGDRVILAGLVEQGVEAVLGKSDFDQAGQGEDLAAEGRLPGAQEDVVYLGALVPLGGQQFSREEDDHRHLALLGEQGEGVVHVDRLVLDDEHAADVLPEPAYRLAGADEVGDDIGNKAVLVAEQHGEEVGDQFLGLAVLADDEGDFLVVGLRRFFFSLFFRHGVMPLETGKGCVFFFF